VKWQTLEVKNQEKKKKGLSYSQFTKTRNPNIIQSGNPYRLEAETCRWLEVTILRNEDMILRSEEEDYTKSILKYTYSSKHTVICYTTLNATCNQQEAEHVFSFKFEEKNGVSQWFRHVLCYYKINFQDCTFFVPNKNTASYLFSSN
jgi:hypothetical protein